VYAGEVVEVVIIGEVATATYSGGSQDSSESRTRYMGKEEAITLQIVTELVCIIM